MSAVSPELIAVIARKLFARINSDPRTLSRIGDFVLGPDKLADGIKNILETGDLKLGDATEAGDFHDSMIEKVIEVVTRLQKGAPLLEADGLLGQMTLRFLMNRRFGHHNRSTEFLPQSTTRSEPGASGNALRYFVEDDRLPDVSGLTKKQVLQLLTEAWGSWKDVCKLDAKHAASRKEANVIIRLDQLKSQPTSVLAVADIGPPRTSQLDLTFDIAEVWTPSMFVTTAAHEMGHLLGIRHEDVAGPGQLMNDVLQEGIRFPQSQDITAVQRIWGAP